MESLDKALLATDIIMEQKAVDPVLLNIGGMTSFADFFLIAGGSSTRQIQSIGRHLVEKMREHGFKSYGTEGESEGQWILMDYGDLIIHLFYEPIRAFYDLEGLWMEAPRIELKHNAPKDKK
ncbi:MAG: ribosome silencing factor [Deltaproteobacteria bacterium]|nr:ribosome silencing factor [Deltaproteobacteria bacterium]